MTDTQIEIIKALKNGLPLSMEPYEEIAQQAGISTEKLLEQLQQWKADGTIRRFGAILRHHRAGYDANTMVVWDVSDDQVERFAEVAVSFKNVSHCYKRPRFGGFPYNLYTMIHGKCKDDCRAIAQSIADQTGTCDYSMLDTTAEFKKSSPVYFSSNEESLNRS